MSLVPAGTPILLQQGGTLGNINAASPVAAPQMVTIPGTANVPLVPATQMIQTQRVAPGTQAAATIRRDSNIPVAEVVKSKEGVSLRSLPVRFSDQEKAYLSGQVDSPGSPRAEGFAQSLSPGRAERVNGGALAEPLSPGRAERVNGNVFASPLSPGRAERAARGASLIPREVIISQVGAPTSPSIQAPEAFAPASVALPNFPGSPYAASAAAPVEVNGAGAGSIFAPAPASPGTQFLPARETITVASQPVLSGTQITAPGSPPVRLPSANGGSTIPLGRVVQGSPGATPYPRTLVSEVPQRGSIFAPAAQQQASIFAPAVVSTTTERPQSPRILASQVAQAPQSPRILSTQAPQSPRIQSPGGVQVIPRLGNVPQTISYEAATRVNPKISPFDYFTMQLARLDEQNLTRPSPNYRGDAMGLGWNNASAIEQAQITRDRIGDPQEVVTGPGGHVIWKRVNFDDGAKLRMIKIYDGKTLHYFPRPHLECVKVVSYLSLPDDKVNGLKEVSDALVYDPVAREVYANAPTLREAILLLLSAKAYSEGMSDRRAKGLFHVMDAQYSGRDDVLGIVLQYLITK